jgi:hypothetical protein
MRQAHVKTEKKFCALYFPFLGGKNGRRRNLRNGRAQRKEWRTQRRKSAKFVFRFQDPEISLRVRVQESEEGQEVFSEKDSSGRTVGQVVLEAGGGHEDAKLECQGSMLSTFFHFFHF